MKKSKSLLIWFILSVVIVISFPIIFSAVTGNFPKFDDFSKAMIPIILLFYPSAIFSAIAYIPIFGKKATYLSMLTGHVSNIKIPCMLNSINILDSDANIELQHSVSVISVCVSNIVTVVITSAILGFFSIYGFSSSMINSPVFLCIMPALFGAIGVSCFKKKKLFSCLLLVALIIVLTINGEISTIYLLLISILIIIVYSVVVATISVYKSKK